MISGARQYGLALTVSIMAAPRAHPEIQPSRTTQPTTFPSPLASIDDGSLMEDECRPLKRTSRQLSIRIEPSAPSQPHLFRTPLRDGRSAMRTNT